MHSNFIYFGNDYNYKFGDAHFTFRNSKTVLWKDPFEKYENAPSVRLYIYMIGELNRITLNIFNSLASIDYIEYPDISAK